MTKRSLFFILFLCGFFYFVTPISADNYGLIPLPVDEYILYQPIISPAEYSSLVAHQEVYPSKFDLRTQNRVTSVKNQLACGSCWAFAVYGALESTLSKEEFFDFSENNLINNHGFDAGPCDGGNELMATAYLTRWSGPINESEDKYNFPSKSPLDPLKHVQNVFFLPKKSSPLDNNVIKHAILNYGAVYSTYYHTWLPLPIYYYNWFTKSYYYDKTVESNHAIVIIGWDDHYKKGNFIPSPPGDGAFIVKNSWGTIMNDNGYFYISYYDTRIGTRSTVFLAEDVNNFDNVYQYDPLGFTDYIQLLKEETWFSNTFTSKDYENLMAAGFYSLKPMSNYEVYYYNNTIKSHIELTEMQLLSKGQLSYAGYYTIPFSDEISLQPDQQFSIIVHLQKDDQETWIPIERRVSNYASSASSNPGESFISQDGKIWVDLYNVRPESNVCIKAFTTQRIKEYQIPTLTPTPTPDVTRIQFSDTPTIPITTIPIQTPTPDITRIQFSDTPTIPITTTPIQTPTPDITRIQFSDTPTIPITTIPIQTPTPDISVNFFETL